MAEESTPAARAPISLPTYSLGQEGKPDHFTASTSREAAAVEAKELAVGDAAFIKRSDLKWTYAVVTEKITGDDASVILRFEVDKDRNRKSFPETQWGKYIRVVHVDDAELAKLTEEAAKVEAEKAEEEAKPEEKKEEVASAAVSSSAASTGGESKNSKGSKGSKTSKTSKVSVKSAKSGSWFGGIFGSSAKEEKSEETKPAVVAEEPKKEETAVEEKPATPTPVVEEEKPATPAPVEVETPVVKESAADGDSVEVTPEGEPVKSKSPVPLSVETGDNTKENSDPTAEEQIKLTAPPTFLPSPKVVDDAVESKNDAVSALRSPLNLKTPLSLKKKNSLVNKLFNKNKNSVQIADTPKGDSPLSPKSQAAKTTNALGDANLTSPKAGEGKKGWFDPEACEVDYDKNPTDLFQALEARQFSYADEMYHQINRQFNKECKTWVVARGQKKKDKAQLRFRALPLHAALVFGAPDDMIKKILNAYPKATRGRDVKGRLPIHLAMEHNASEEVVAHLLEAFPKGFFAKDKKEMSPLDYINGNMERAYMKKYLPLIADAKVEEERAKWQLELESALEAQKVALKTDPVYMEDVIAAVTDDVEDAYATKMELLETNYQKEIQLLKKKHDSETQALLEGFEVKLNFERKLQKLKGKK